MTSYPELEGHSFEILKLEPQHEHWLAQFAVDGKPYPPFFEPKHNVVNLREEEFLDHMRSQALTMQEYVEQRAARA